MNKPVAEYKGWQIYQMPDGTFEAYKSKNVQSTYVTDKGDMRKIAKDIDRRVLAAKTLNEAMDEVARLRRPRIVKTYDPNKDPNQTRIQ
jgi:hypothetical protein